MMVFRTRGQRRLVAAVAFALAGLYRPSWGSDSLRRAYRPFYANILM